MRRIKVTWRLWRNHPTRKEAWMFLIGKVKLADWEIECLLYPKMPK